MFTRLIFGFAIALAIPFLPWVSDLPAEARLTTFVVAFTAWCWLTNTLPLPVASLLPAFLLPITGVLSARAVAPLYFQDILMLFLGGFILALSLERHQLHKRFALRALTLFGAKPRKVVLGFMFAAASLSMFVSNTSTALLLLPVALAVLDGCSAENRHQLSPPLLLGIAYACSIGGVGTPIGTAPNAVLLGQLLDRFPDAPVIPFGTWMLGTLPFVFAFLFCAWFVLVRVAWKLPHYAFPGLNDLRSQRISQEKRSKNQNRVAFIFGLVAFAWITRQGANFGSFYIPGWQLLLPESTSAAISDATVALGGVLLLFVTPSESDGPLMKWADCKNIPWGVLLLLGGGFALAKACETSGLSAAAGASLGQFVSSVSPLEAIFCVSLMVTFLTEITSNTATISLMLPLLFSTCLAADIHPMLLAVPATMAVSCAFMLPVATPPNAILFASGQLRISQMARAGLLLNILTAVLVTFFAYFWTLPTWGFDLSEMPKWTLGH
ncbi:MAG: DASS family sodium-coupled anion symporter [Planctomycetota bacterium]|jgi:sodium-dependent dicarboxylate transporter 2/3/5|nr:DASS family sodium-coupled anion symporter [Planctomycetota bacterium]MDP6941516.1 DASS family sodium-coupled anion symporter [Planctomycetota bacterium]